MWNSTTSNRHPQAFQPGTTKRFTLSKAPDTATNFDNMFKPKPRGCMSDVYWKEPPEHHILTEYFRLNTMHGLKYVAEPKRHLSERLCWLLAFLIGMSAAVYMINDIWENYKRNPVIVSFKPTEVDITDVPFPAVTLCNMNKISNKLYNKVLTRQKSTNSEVRETATADLQILKSICETQQSFAQIFDFAEHRGKVAVSEDASSWRSNETTSEILALLIEDTVPCHEMIRLCLWGGEKVNCSKLFVPIVTEYGKCCTFNLLPYELLLAPTILHYYTEAAEFVKETNRGEQRTANRWSPEEINKWRKWDFTNDGFLLKPELERPYRQSRAGVPFGLSILVDPLTDEYFCPSTDSEGFRIVLHTALEVPPVSNWGVAVGLQKEIFMDVKIDMTLADSAVAGFPYEKRLCYFQSEKNLEYYKAYTTSNCLAECAARWIARNCSCAPFHMPREPSVRICSSDPDGPDQACVESSQSNLTKTFRKACPDCDSLCSDIFYNFDATQADLQPSKLLWTSVKDGKVPEWANNKMSIVHLYFGGDSFVPRIRNQLYAMVDLIANTGGLLGLCLGFSALSLVEIVYFFTLRFFWQRVRRRAAGKKIAEKFVRAIKNAWTDKTFAAKPLHPVDRVPTTMIDRRGRDTTNFGFRQDNDGRGNYGFTTARYPQLQDYF